jgi:integrase/recombinase XerD
MTVPETLHQASELPAGLDGAPEDVRKRIVAILESSGSNRSSDGCQIRAESDLDAIKAWLGVTASKSDATYRRYAGEAKRLITWLAVDAEMCVSDVTVVELVRYRDFLRNPQPESLWCTKVADGGLGVMRGPASERSANHSMVIIRSLFTFLTETRYLSGNPFAAFGKIKFIAKDASGREYEAPTGSVNERIVPKEWIDAMWSGLEQGDDGSRRHFRDRWVLRLMSSTGIRRMEAVTLCMSDVFNWYGDWYLSVIGKGRKLRKVPLANSVIEELKRYRESLGLPGLPISSESGTPLISKISQQSPITTNHLQRIVTSIADRGSSFLVGSGQPDAARELREFTPHLFRRYFATTLFLDGADIVDVQSLLGHESVDTTRIYTIESNSAAIKAVKTSFD